MPRGSASPNARAPAPNARTRERSHDFSDLEPAHVVERHLGRRCSSRHALRRSAPRFSAMTRCEGLCRRRARASRARNARSASSCVSPSAARTKLSRGQRGVALLGSAKQRGERLGVGQAAGRARARRDRAPAAASQSASPAAAAGRAAVPRRDRAAPARRAASDSHGCTSSITRATPVSPELARSMAASALGTVASSLQPRVAVHSITRAPAQRLAHEADRAPLLVRHDAHDGHAGLRRPRAGRARTSRSRQLLRRHAQDLLEARHPLRELLDGRLAQREQAVVARLLDDVLGARLARR